MTVHFVNRTFNVYCCFLSNIRLVKQPKMAYHLALRQRTPPCKGLTWGEKQAALHFPNDSCNRIHFVICSNLQVLRTLKVLFV